MTALPDVPNIEIGTSIGAGSFGQVYRGRHRTLNVDVAVKVIETGAVPRADGVLQEARLMARLDHPNLLRIFDAGQAEASLYLVLELMDDTCGDLHRIAPDRAVDLLLQLLAGLQALHDARILHRDIKPANCLTRSRDGRVKLADLGIAVEQTSSTRHRFELAGTLPFMAPELFDNPPRFSPASDLYALGVTMQCLLLEQPPYPAKSTMQELMAWIHTPNRPRISDSRPDLPPALASLIDRMSAHAAADRPSLAAEALASLGKTTAPAIATREIEGATLRVIGSWIVGREIPHDGNFHEYAVTHRTSGAGGRLKHLKPRKPLSGASQLILASAERASRLAHPGIADLVDWGTHEDLAYVVTRSQGHTLQTIVKGSGPFDEVEALQVTRDVADAVTYLHGVGLVYQVVNPGFAMLAGDARSVQLAWPMFCVPAGSPVHSPESPLLISVPLFAAPESLVRPPRSKDQTAGEAAGEVTITERADLYGLGEILFFLVAGRPAFSETPELPAVIFAKLRGPADLRAAVPSVSAPTAQLVRELTDPDPAKRPESAAAVRDRLDRILSRLRP